MSDADGQRLSVIRALGLRDVILMTIVAVVSMRWIARAARMGTPSLTLWILAAFAFFLPLAMTVCELSSRYPEQGGVYAWVRRAFGLRHGFVCGWCLWVNNLFYFPSLLLFGAANFAAATAGTWPSLGDSRWFAVAFVIAGIWLSAAVNIHGLGTGKWLQNVGSAGIWIPAGLLIACGAIALVTSRGGGPATALSTDPWWPQAGTLDTLGVWSAMCFAFSGFEITSLVGQEVRDPRRTIPTGVIIAGAATAIFYVVGTAAVLVSLAPAELRELSGITDAVEVVGRRVGVGGLASITGLLIALNALAGTASWTAGAARVPFAAGVDRTLPSLFGRLHPRYRTPHVALVVQAAASTVIFLTSLLLAVGGRRSSIQDAYDVLVNLTILIYFIPYLYLFAALVRLRQDDAPPDARQIRVPGGRLGVWIVAATGFLATALSLALTFVPPPGASVLNYETNLILQAALILGAGVLLYAVAGRTRDRPQSPGAPPRN